MTTNSPRPFEVWRLEFVYEDQPEVSKARPVIVAVVDHDKDTASRYGPLSEEDARAVEQALRDLDAIL